ncbi:MAG: hypothetical protein M5U34_33790 [Chloroflexi bacterium]|nr:hypothetical protein [Chloroflexota bacterium]
MAAGGDSGSSWYHLGIMRAHDGEGGLSGATWNSLTHVLAPYLRNLARLKPRKKNRIRQPPAIKRRCNFAPDLPR